MNHRRTRAKHNRRNWYDHARRRLVILIGLRQLTVFAFAVVVVVVVVVCRSARQFGPPRPRPSRRHANH
jgi:hypothetical protein